MDALPRPSARDRHWYVEDESLRRTLREGGAAAVSARLAAEIPPGTKGEVRVYLVAPCAQSCAFCADAHARRRPSRRALATIRGALGIEAPYDARVDGVIALLDAVAARAPEVVAQVTGHDWARHPRLDRVLARLEREPLVPVTLVGPGTALADPALAARVAALPWLRGIRVTVLSADAAVHDEIVGAPGAWEAVTRAVGHLTGAGVALRVNVVLTARNAEGLGETLAWIEARGLRAALLGFVPDGEHPAGSAGSLALDAAALRALLARHLDQINRCVTEVSGMPDGALPPGLRPAAG